MPAEAAPAKRYLHGPPCAGKTSRLAAQLVHLIEHDGVRPDRVLLLVPQMQQRQRFREALGAIRAPGRPRGEPEITTFYGLARRHVSLFWPMISGAAGFASSKEPTFINVELAQYFLNRFVEPRADEFDDLRLYRPRLLGQILDSMNKAAECGFALDGIAVRLTQAWTGETRRAVHFAAAQHIALEFRAFCLQHNLLDFSLLMQTFDKHLLHTPAYLAYARARSRHVLADNIEEYPPIAHDFLAQLLPDCESALLVEDDPGGYRLFLGADAVSARKLARLCNVVDAAEPAAQTPLAAFGDALAAQFEPDARARATRAGAPVTSMADKYWAGMVKLAAARVQELVAGGAPPESIAVLAPFVEDVLRFELAEQLKPANIAVQVLRPSRPLFDHPVSRALVTLAKLRNPAWKLPVTAPELARALSVCIAGLDVARAQLIADAALAVSTQSLAQVDDQALWNRVGMRFYPRYGELVNAVRIQQSVDRGQTTEDGSQKSEVRSQKSVVSSQIERAEGGADGSKLKAQGSPLMAQSSSHSALSTQHSALSTPYSALDLFWQQLFTEVLSREGFGVHGDFDAARACDRLISSAREFREVLNEVEAQGEDHDLAYIALLSQGILAASTTPAPPPEPLAQQGVLLVPVYAFLTHNLRAQHQIWLDVSSLGWYERIRQPLTHPHVLSRRWAEHAQAGDTWTDEHEHREQRAMLGRVVRGLTLRCANTLSLAQSQLGLSGQEDDGPLARAAQNVLAVQAEVRA